MLWIHISFLNVLRRSFVPLTEKGGMHVRAKSDSRGSFHHIQHPLFYFNIRHLTPSINSRMTEISRLKGSGLLKMFYLMKVCSSRDFTFWFAGKITVKVIFE
ncbi:hypothetical protein NPIL_404751 [Nephila pilipes]|uniref:Uncharacterized protein n=1 Tax=Nephila pilipes TaxID=299642 RepID=A0A8X6UX28_NEPPI|nr:hypothetical protein NPIL_404751 [Nephila pilipes]